MRAEELEGAIESLKKKEELLDKFMAARLAMKDPCELRKDEDEVYCLVQMINNLFKTKLIDDEEHKKILERLREKIAKKGIFISLPFAC